MALFERCFGESLYVSQYFGFPAIAAFMTYLFLKKSGSTYNCPLAKHPEHLRTTVHRRSRSSIEIHTPSSSDPFTPDILIRSRTGEYKIAAAALDTQCQQGDWISRRLIRRLDLIDSIYNEPNLPGVATVTVTGEEVESCGSIDLDWKLATNKNRIYHGKFFVLPNEDFDVIFGQETLNREHIISAHSSKLFATLAAHKKLNKAEKDAIAAAEAQQLQDKKNLEARRQATQQNQSSNQPSGQQQQ